MSLIVSNPINYSASTTSSTITWRTVATFSATNIGQLMDNAWSTGREPFAAVMDMGDEGAANLLNLNPTVINHIAEAGGPNDPGYDFEIDWGHQADAVGCMIVPNADYTSFAVEVGYRYMVPGTYNWSLVIMADDGSNKTISGTANVTGRAPTQGGNTYIGPQLVDTTYVSLYDMT